MMFSLQIVVPQLNRTGNIIAEATSQTMPPSSDWKYATFNMTLPFNTAYFTTRFVAEASKGTVDIRDVRADYVLLQRNASTSFGFTLPLLGGNLNFELPRGQTLVQFEGNG